MFLLCTDSSQSGWSHVDTYMHVLGLWSANTAAAKLLSSAYNDRLVCRSFCTDLPHKKWNTVHASNILYLNIVVNKCLTTSKIKYPSGQ